MGVLSVWIVNVTAAKLSEVEERLQSMGSLQFKEAQLTKQEHSDELQRVRDEHQLEIEAASDATNRLKAAHEEELHQLLEEHQATKQRINDEHAAAVQELISEHGESELKSQQAAMEGAMEVIAV